MFAVNTYEEIEKREREIGIKQLVVLLFVRPTSPNADQIIREFNYIHWNSDRYCSVYAVGYTQNAMMNPDEFYHKVQGTCGDDWYYSDRVFIQFKENLKHRLKWNYGGEAEILLLQSNPDGGNILDFSNYLCIDISYGLKHEYIESFPKFMESLVNSARREVTASEVIGDMQKSMINKKRIAQESIRECTKLSGPLRKILSDRIFYKTCKSY